MLGIEPNLTSSAILFIGAIIGFISFLPQIIKTLKTKKSDDIAITSWVIWIIGYTLTAIYAFVFTKDIVFFGTEALELSICLFTLLVCLKYRNKEVM
jgi:uncharacterized protein with PQ loop repeat